MIRDWVGGVPGKAAALSVVMYGVVTGMQQGRVLNGFMGGIGTAIGLAVIANIVDGIVTASVLPFLH